MRTSFTVQGLVGEQSSRANLVANIQKAVGVFNRQVHDFTALVAARMDSKPKGLVKEFIDLDPSKISWTLSLKNRLVAQRRLDFDRSRIVRVATTTRNRHQPSSALRPYEDRHPEQPRLPRLSLFRRLRGGRRLPG